MRALGAAVLAGATGLAVAAGGFLAGVFLAGVLLAGLVVAFGGALPDLAPADVAAAFVVRTFLLSAFLAVDFLAVDFLAVDFLAVDFLAVDFLAVDFLAVDFLVVTFFTVPLLVEAVLDLDGGRAACVLRACLVPLVFTAAGALAVRAELLLGAFAVRFPAFAGAESLARDDCFFDAMPTLQPDTLSGQLYSRDAAWEALRVI